MHPPDSTRLTLLLRLRNRSDQLSWEEFHDRYAELLLRYARARGASHADAEDIVQEVELSVFKAIQGFQYDARKGRFRNYLRSAVINAMSRSARKQARQPAALDPNNFDYLAADRESSGDDGWTKEWRHHRLRWALRAVASEFEPNTMQAFQLHALAGLSVAETAKHLGISEASVYQAKSRILRRVRAQLKDLDPDEDV